MITDFTKEELKIIYLNLCVNPKTKDLLNKVQSMINNYCEHEWDDAATNQFYCVKCQKHIDKI